MYPCGPRGSTPGRALRRVPERPRSPPRRALTPPARPASVPLSRPPRGPRDRHLLRTSPTHSMTRFRSAAGALLLAAVLAPAHARAQGEDARVLPRGWIELRGGGFYTQF